MRRLALACAAGVLSAVSGIGLLAVSGWLISRSAQRPPVLYLMVPIAAVQAFGLGRAGFRYAERLAGHDAALRILARVRVSAFGRLERLAPAGLAAFRSGDLISRLAGDIDSLTDRWLRVRLPYAIAACAGAAAVAFTALVLPAAAVVLAFSLTAVAIAAPLLSGLASRRAERDLVPRRGELAAATVDLLRGAGELRVFAGAGPGGTGATDTGAAGAGPGGAGPGGTGAGGTGPGGAGAGGAGPGGTGAGGTGPGGTGAGGAGPGGTGAGALRAVAAANAEVARCERRSAYARGGAAGITALAAGTALWGAVVLGVAGVRSGTLAGVMLAAVVLIPLATHEVFSGLAPAAQQIPRLRAAAARVAELSRLPGPVTEPAVPALVPPPPYDIVIGGLAARWQADGPEVLRGLDLDLPAGSRTAVTGASGAGKTTLAMVLLRFLDPAAGRVTLGGTDLTALNGDQVRSVIGLCAQDAHIFDSTLRENLRLARPAATGSDLDDALRRARLDDWVATLPAGLDTPVGEHGARLSGGQRQRLALARVLLADFPVVIFDEPAEHLDEPAADALTRDLLTATAGRTVLLITHRPTAALPLDQVIRLPAAP